jgi:pimeloyl-ACP methyl ester carboxylesterase
MTEDCIAQSTADYDDAIAKVKTFYNAQQADSLFNMCTDRIKSLMPLEKTKQVFTQLNGQVGTLKSYRFTKQEKGLSYYKVDFHSATLSLVVALDKDNKLETFRFIPYTQEVQEADGSTYTYNSPTGDIVGTLTMPAGAAKVPVAIIIAGSGPTDRNGNNTISGKSNTYKMIADSLLKQGIACIRYDKRGVNASVAALKDEAGLRFDDMVADACGFIKMAKQDTRFSKITIIGHSEGSLIGMIAAAKEQVNSYISVAGIAQRADKIIEKQIAAQSKDLAAKATIILDSLVAGYTVTNTEPSLNTLFNSSVQPYMISWLKYDPIVEIKKLKQPILIVQGDNDMQVPKEEAEQLKKAAPTATLKIIKGMNHVLKQAPADRTQNLATYGNSELPLSPELMPEIVKFINSVKSK